jgi:hypothetical protein
MYLCLFHEACEFSGQTLTVLNDYGQVEVVIPQVFCGAWFDICRQLRGQRDERKFGTEQVGSIDMEKTG